MSFLVLFQIRVHGLFYFHHIYVYVYISSPKNVNTTCLVCMLLVHVFSGLAVCYWIINQCVFPCARLFLSLSVFFRVIVQWLHGLPPPPFTFLCLLLLSLFSACLVSHLLRLHGYASELPDSTELQQAPYSSAFYYLSASSSEIFPVPQLWELYCRFIC